MGERAPEFADFFQNINERMYDLMEVFRKGYYVVASHILLQIFKRSVSRIGFLKR
jgi:hypothetical protein